MFHIDFFYSLWYSLCFLYGKINLSYIKIAVYFLKAKLFSRSVN